MDWLDLLLPYSLPSTLAYKPNLPVTHYQSITVPDHKGSLRSVCGQMSESIYYRKILEDALLLPKKLSDSIWPVNIEGALSMLIIP